MKTFQEILKIRREKLEQHRLEMSELLQSALKPIESNPRPTSEQRISALEEAVADLATAQILNIKGDEPNA